MSSNEFSVIFILDQTTEKVRESLKEINFLKKVKHFKIISISQNLGHSYCFNFALPYIDTPYVYFASSSVVLKPNFVSSINNALKDKNAFTPEAQKEAFKRTYNAVLNILTDDALDYLNTIYDDLETYITETIEASVYYHKQ